MANYLHRLQPRPPPVIADIIETIADAEQRSINKEILYIIRIYLLDHQEELKAKYKELNPLWTQV